MFLGLSLLLLLVAPFLAEPIARCLQGSSRSLSMLEWHVELGGVAAGVDRQPGQRGGKLHGGHSGKSVVLLVDGDVRMEARLRRVGCMEVNGRDRESDR